MAITLLPAPKFTIQGDNGSLAAGWLVNTYEINTTTPKATYTDATGGTPNANPVELDERGEADIWWNGYYKVVVTRPDGSNPLTTDNFGLPQFAGIEDTATSTQLTLTDTAATFNGDVIVLKDLIQKIGADVASASLLTLGDGNIFDVTGTTAITSIASKGIGSVVYLQFDGILTLTHHATDLILPGADDIITAAGDQAVLYEYATADWRCISFVRASNPPVLNSGINIKEIDVGDWDMDATNAVAVTHGLTLGKIRSVKITVRKDDGLTQFTDGYIPSGGTQSHLWVATMNATTITFARFTTGWFDDTEFSSTSYNRGWVVIEYVD